MAPQTIIVIITIAWATCLVMWCMSALELKKLQRYTEQLDLFRQRLEVVRETYPYIMPSGKAVLIMDSCAEIREEDKPFFFANLLIELSPVWANALLDWDVTGPSLKQEVVNYLPLIEDENYNLTEFGQQVIEELKKIQLCCLKPGI